MSDKFQLNVFDGANTIGGTKILLHEGDRGLLLDFGLNYNRFNTFFEEYLKPRKPAGLRDFWLLKLVPPYPELYRPSLKVGTLPNAEELPVKQIDGVVLSHAHMDHAGLIGLLKRNIPIVSSATTLAILRAYQDSGRTEFYQETTYASPHEMKTRRTHHFIETPRAQPHQGRNALVMNGELSKELAQLWQRQADPSGSTRSRKMVSGEISTMEKASLEWKIESFPVDHSILGACAVAVETENGAIVYTGDFRSHGIKSAQTKAFVKEATKLDPFVLIVEGTRVTRDNGDTITEKDCKENCLKAVEAAKDRLVVADFSPRNIERLGAFHEIARKTDRRLVVLPKDAYLLDSLQGVESGVPIPTDSLLVYDPLKAREAKWEQWILDRYGDFVIAPNKIKSAQSEYLLTFSFLDIKHLIDIQPKGGVYIYSSSEPYTEEQKIDFWRLSNWLSYFNLEVRGFKFENDQPVLESGYHCSGHVSAEDLMKIISTIGPKILMPVHTKDPQWFKDKFADSFQVILDG